MRGYSIHSAGTGDISLLFRGRFRIVEGQKFFLVPYGDDLIMKAVPKDPSNEMSKIIGDLQFNKKDRKKAEKWLLRATQSRKRSS